MHENPRKPILIMPERSTTDAIFILKLTIEKRLEGKKDVRVTFIDLKKDFKGDA